MSRPQKIARFGCSAVMALNAVCVLLGTFVLLSGSLMMGFIVIIANLVSFNGVRKERDRVLSPR